VRLGPRYGWIRAIDQFHGFPQVSRPNGVVSGLHPLEPTELAGRRGRPNATPLDPDTGEHTDPALRERGYRRAAIASLRRIGVT
jgi:hypothetical protein